MEYWAGSASLWLDVRRSDHLAPLLSISRHERAELGRRAFKHGGPDIGNPRLDPRAVQTRIDLFFKLLNDLDGRIPRSGDALPPYPLVVWKKFCDGRDIGNTSERVKDVTANARNLPSLIYSIAVEIGSIISGTCPARRSVMAGPPPRYGTWAISIIAILLNISP
jgi:hypothetical protein